MPVLVDDDALAVLGVEAAGHPHVQLEARTSHVHLIISNPRRAKRALGSEENSRT